jgi:drug/metabolite transporter (DMT)-like permease
MVLFKIIEKQKTGLFSPIVINYITASALGFAISDISPLQSAEAVPLWLYFSIIIGVLFIGNFFLIGLSTQKSGIAVTTISVKMSFVIPVAFSIIFDINDNFSFTKLVLIALAAVSVYLVVSPDKNIKKDTVNHILPVVIFFSIGILDSVVKYSQYNFIDSEEFSSLFSSISFTVAGIIGVVAIFFNKQNLQSFVKIKTWVLGILLGVVNFGSLYFFINALNSLKFNSSIVLGINSIGIVVMSVVAAVVLFKEHFSLKNRIGLILSILVLIFAVYNL